MFTTATPGNRDMADVDRLKHWDEGSEHSNCVLIKLSKLRMINHSGLETVLGGLPMSALSESKSIQEVLNSGMWSRPDNQGSQAGCQAARLPKARLAASSVIQRWWWPVDP